MAIEKMFWITCDECGEDSHDDLYGRYSSDVRQQAKEEGWRIGNKHICPMCLEGGTNE